MKLKLQVLLGLFFCLQIAAQTGPAMYIKPMSGKVFIDNKELSLKAITKWAVTGKELVIAKNAKVMVYMGDKVAEFGSANSESRFTKAKLQPIFDKLFSTPGMKTLVSYMYRMYKINEPKPEDVDSPGGYKGLDDKANKLSEDRDDVFFPSDSSQIAADQVVFSWKMRRQIMSPKMFVIFNGTDTIYQNKEMPQEGKQNIALSKPGRYQWIIRGKSRKDSEIINTFTKLDAAAAAKRKNCDAEFEKSLDFLSEESRIQLMSDYNKLTN